MGKNTSLIKSREKYWLFLERFKQQMTSANAVKTPAVRVRTSWAELKCLFILHMHFSTTSESLWTVLCLLEVAATSIFLVSCMIKCCRIIGSWNMVIVWQKKKKEKEIKKYVFIYIWRTRTQSSHGKTMVATTYNLSFHQNAEYLSLLHWNGKTENKRYWTEYCLLEREKVLKSHLKTNYIR